MGVIDIVNSPTVHLVPAAADTLIMFKVAADDAWPRAAEWKRCKVMSLFPCPFTVLIAIAMGNLGKSLDSATHARQRRYSSVVS
jgi:hypothetical protein